MTPLKCPACGGDKWLPVLRLFLDVGTDRPPWPLPLEREPEDVWYQCWNGCVSITGEGEFIGAGVKRTEENSAGQMSEEVRIP